LKTEKTLPTINDAKAFDELGGSGAGPALLWLRCSREDVAMRTAFDFSPLYRSTVGFDRLFDLIDQTARQDTPPHWPPYNVEKVGDDQYRITMAVAGFSPDEIEITQKENVLLVVGHKHPEQENGQFLHRGIATRAFQAELQPRRLREGPGGKARERLADGRSGA
jgi:molecular chaperone IbpA